MAPLFAVLFYFCRGLTRKAGNYSKFYDVISVSDHDRPVPDRKCAVSVLREALRPGTVDADNVCLLVSLLVMCLGNITPKFSHELVLADSNTVDAVERNCLDENASMRGGPHAVCGGYY